MKVLKWIGIILVALIVILIIAGLMAPNDFKARESIVIDAPKDKVFSYVAHFEHFNEWSPWSELDSNLTYEIKGEDGTVGAEYHWEGNEEVGKGNMTIDHIQGMDSIAQTVTFLEPFEDQSQAYFLLEQTPKGTKTTWGFYGHYSFPMNLFMSAMGMTGSIGNDYQKGLKHLKKLVESAPNQMGNQIEKMDMPQTTYLVLQENDVAFDQMSQFFEKAFGMVFQSIKQNELEARSAPMAIYTHWDEANQQADLGAGMAIKDTNYTPSAPLTTMTVGPAKALKMEYFGGYEGIGEAHNQMDHYIKANDLEQAGPVMEEYITDPGSEPDTAKWQTDIIYVVK